MIISITNASGSCPIMHFGCSCSIITWNCMLILLPKRLIYPHLTVWTFKIWNRTQNTKNGTTMALVWKCGLLELVYPEAQPKGLRQRQHHWHPERSSLSTHISSLIFITHHSPLTHHSSVIIHESKIIIPKIS